MLHSGSPNLAFVRPGPFSVGSIDDQLNFFILQVIDQMGVFYNPLSDSWNRSRDMDVNYMMLAERPKA